MPAKRYGVGIAFALLTWDLLGSEIGFLAFVALVCVAAVACLALGVLGLPFWKLSEEIHPRLQDALRRGQMRRTGRLELAQKALDHTGDFVVGFAAVGAVAAAVIAIWGVLTLAVGVGALVVLGLIGAGAERLGLIKPSV